MYGIKPIILLGVCRDGACPVWVCKKNNNQKCRTEVPNPESVFLHYAKGVKYFSPVHYAKGVKYFSPLHYAKGVEYFSPLHYAKGVKYYSLGHRPRNRTSPDESMPTALNNNYATHFGVGEILGKYFLL